jgi:hypothetical protein
MFNMTTKEKFEKLKELDINAKSEVEREKINVEMEQLADSDPKGFEAAVMESAKQTLTDIKTLKIKEQMAQVTDIISMNYIAKTYFNKSKSWLSQRMNELDVNGKPAKFLPDEIDTLNFAFKDISKKIGSFRISC